jgi:hypothetical protein
MPRKEFARFSATLGRGVVYTGYGTYVIEVSKMYQPEVAGCTNLYMWMQGPQDIQEMEAGDYPFKAVYDQLKAAVEAVRKPLLKE